MLEGIGGRRSEGTTEDEMTGWNHWLDGHVPAMLEMQAPSLGQEDPLEEGTATHSSILAWIPSGCEGKLGVALESLHQKRRGILRFRPQLEMRPSSIAPIPVES